MTALSFLFQAIDIGPLHLKNRIVRAPMCTHFANADGSVNERLLDFYEEIARGGPGLVMVEFCYIDEKASQCDFNQIGIHDDAMIRGLSELADVIKAQGPLAGLQLCHAGRQRASGQLPIVAPSPVPWPDIGIVPQELTEEEIGRIVQAFGRAAARAKRAGFNLVEIHGAHGYLITEFLSPDTNRRKDKYGGSFANRQRFALEVVAEVRKAVGDGFPISFRMSGDEYVQGGITLDEARQTAKELERAGVTLVHVSAGTRVTNEYQIIPMFLPKGCNLHLAQGIKEVVSVPVVAAGALGDPLVADQAIREGKADLVSLARPLLADPELPRKAKEGRLKEIRLCIRCNDCVSQIRVSKSVRCTVNFRAGKEGCYRLEPAAQPKKVLVIGGGPAGLETARVAALKGHEVTLYEKEAELGGHLRLASFLPELKELLDYYLHQMEKLKVNILLGKEAGYTEVEAHKPDCTVVAVGGDPVRPAIPGIDSERVLTVIDLFQGAEPGKKVVVVGGNLIGCEAAWVLADLGKDIAIVEPGPEIPLDVEKGTNAIFRQEFARHRVQSLPGARLIQVTPEGLEVGLNGGRQLLPADHIVLALGFIPRHELLNELAQRGFQPRAVGDCRFPARLMGAIHDGALAGWEV